MICYMPFSFIGDETIQKLTSTLGAITVYAPSSRMVPEHMRAWMQSGSLCLRYPRGIKDDDLDRAMSEFKAWADLHRGQLADMASFFKSSGGAPPLVDETLPTQIGAQIRHFGEVRVPEPGGSLFQAALFLAMAQEYDRHNDTVFREMQSLQAMEKAMMARLSGNEEDAAAEFAAGLHADPLAGRDQAGAYMTSKRVEAWAELAARDPQPFHLYITTRPEVTEYLQQRLPAVQGPWAWEIAPAENGAGAPHPSMAECLSTLAHAGDPAAAARELCRQAPDGSGACRLMVYVLAGVPAPNVPAMLSGDHGQIQRPDSPDSGARHTLFGLMDLRE